MIYRNYLIDVLQFAEDSKNWGGLDPYQFYNTAGRGWLESCDNSQGGAPIDWAFHKTPEHIRENAPQAFADWIISQIDLAVQLDDLEFLENFIKEF